MLGMSWGRLLSVVMLTGSLVVACDDDDARSSSGDGGGTVAGPGPAGQVGPGAGPDTSTGPGSGAGGPGGDCGHQGEAEPAVVAGVTAAHNAARCAAPTDNPMPPLLWDPTVASVAQAYADQLASQGCPLSHSSGPYGENLFWGSGSYSAQEVVDAWMSEEPCYDPGSGQCTCQPCGHYTQIVWRQSLRLGCGASECSDGGIVWVCNYDPPGNFIGQPAF